MCLLVYDYFITLPTEVKYVWKTKWTPGKILFFLIRYTAFVAEPLMLWQEFATRDDNTSCTVAIYLSVCNTMLGYPLAGLVVGLRTWAIWNRRRTFGILLLLAWGSMCIVAGYYGIVAMLRISVEPNLPIGGCGTFVNTTGTPSLLKAFAIVAGYETFVFCATVGRGVYFLRAAPSTLTFVLYRDAFLSSICLLAIALSNVVLSGAITSNFYDSYFLGRVFCAILPGRIMLNLREATLSVDAWDAGTEVPTVDVNSFALTDVDNGRNTLHEFR